MRFLKRVGISGAIFLLLILLIELVLSLTYNFPSGYYTYPPKSGFDIDIKVDYVPGIVDSISNVSFNSVGARSDEIPEKVGHKMAVIGGSTTACFALRQDKTWTSLLNSRLGENYWIGNFGRLGNDTNHHVLQVEQLFKHETLKDVKTVLFLIGTNDFGRFLGDSENYLSNSRKKVQLGAFAYLPNSELPYFRRLTLFKLLKKAKQAYQSSSSKNVFGKSQRHMQQLRQRSPKLDDLPDLSRSLAHYEQNIRMIIRSVRDQGKVPVFMTQPTMWSNNLNEYQKGLLLMGGSYNKKNPERLLYYTSRALAEGIDKFNTTLRIICLEENVLCLDLDSRMPKTTETFYDDCHFNEQGALEISRILYSFLKQNDIVH